jgi:hypothetical protein
MKGEKGVIRHKVFNSGISHKYLKSIMSATITHHYSSLAPAIFFGSS